MRARALYNALQTLGGDFAYKTKEPGIITELSVESRRELLETIIERIVIDPKGRKPRIQVCFRS